jgi:hypothetical protein
MNDETQLAFPPFVPAKPKGGVPEAFKAPKSTVAEVVAEAEAKAEAAMSKPRRKRRTAAEMAAANGPAPVDSFAVYFKIVELLQPVTPKMRLDMLHMLMEYHT